MDVFIATYLAFGLGFLFLTAYIFLMTSSDVMTKMEVRNFKMLIIAFQVYVVLANIQTLEEHGGGVIKLTESQYKAVCFALFFSLVFLTFVYYLFILNRFDLGAIHNTRAIFLGLIPISIMTMLLVASIFNGSIFGIEQAGGHLRQTNGKFYYILHVCVAIYFVAILQIAFSKAKKSGSSQSKKEAMALFWPVLAVIIWVILDNPLEGTTVIPVAVFAIIFHLFITAQKSNIYTDTLTGMNNRRKAELFLASELKSCSETEPIYLFMGDINGFKLINDEHGHYEGDCALMIFSEAVKKSAAAYEGFAARYGGDEFVWAWRPIKNGDVDPEMVISDIRHRVEAECKAQQRPYVLSLSIGHILCTDPKRTADSYLKEADRLMYADKQGYYRNKR